MNTKIVLRDYNELKFIAQDGDSTRKIDDKLNLLLKYIGSMEMDIDEILINPKGDGGKNLTFVNNNLSPERNFYNVKIPESWTTSVSLNDNQDKIYCKKCNFMVSPDSVYHFPDEKILESGTAGEADAVYRKALYQDRLDDNTKDTVCPVCSSINRFATLA